MVPESPTPPTHRDGLPVERVGDVGLGGGGEGHDVGLALALRVARGHAHLAALANLDGRHDLGVPHRGDAGLVQICKNKSKSDEVHFTSNQGAGSVFIIIITYRRPPEPRPVRHTDCV